MHVPRSLSQCAQCSGTPLKDCDSWPQGLSPLQLFQLPMWWVDLRTLSSETRRASQCSIESHPNSLHAYSNIFLLAAILGAWLLNSVTLECSSLYVVHREGGQARACWGKNVTMKLCNMLSKLKLPIIFPPSTSLLLSVKVVLTPHRLYTNLTFPHHMWAGMAFYKITGFLADFYF